jgi:GT2 family glycosyltransferase
MDVSIVIVNYNTKTLLDQCISSIYGMTKDVSFEIIVSDNNSTDGSVELLHSKYPDIIILNNMMNLGFGRANNRGIRKASGKYIFYLNSDTLLLNNVVKYFFDYFEEYGDEKSIGALGSSLVNINGEYIHSYGEIKKFSKKNYELFRCLLGITKDTFIYLCGKELGTVAVNHKQEKYIGSVPYITGADLFVRNNEFAEFDKIYFMYNEEVDLQLRMHRAGLQSYIIDGPGIVHLEGGSTKKNPKKIKYLSSSANIQLFISYVQFYKKNFYNLFNVFVMKFLIILIWCNPLIIKDTNKFIKKIIKL